MEFLDPEEKRERTIRLFVGYALVGILILFGTFIISFILQGFNILTPNTDVRNGLLFVDSKPLSADIFINENQEKRTDARFVLPEGQYNVRLSESGYRDWQKIVDVIGGSVTYHIYPRLFPIDIKKTITATYVVEPKIWTESPNRGWIVVSANNTEPLFNITDTSKANESPTQITIPENVISKTDMATASFTVIEWSSDNRHILVQKTLPDSTVQYVLLDREKPEESVNITSSLSLPQGISLRLRDKKYDQYYMLESTTKLLRRATLSGGIEPVIVADGVVAYSPYEANVILYATESGAKQGTYAVRILDGATNYLLQPVVASQTILLDIAKYEGDWFVVTGSNAQDNSLVYINPLQNSSNTDASGALRSQLSLQMTAPRYVGFSDNARFIAVQNDVSFTVYDAELKTIYTFDSPVTLPKEGASWMDGHRLHVVSNGAEQVFEYDGNNHQTLVEAQNGLRAFYDRDYVRLFTLVPQADGSFNYQVSRLTLTD